MSVIAEPTPARSRRPLTATIVRTHDADLRTVARHALADHHPTTVTVDDVVSSAWNRVARYGLPGDDGPLGPWLRTITRRVAHDLAARAARDQRPPPDPLPGLTVADPADLTVARARAAWLRTAIAQLTPQRRAALTGVVLTGRSRASVAHDLGITPQRVGQLVAAALADLHHAARRSGWAE